MKAPPHDVDAEEIVIGSLLRTPSLFFEATDMHPQWFYRQSNRLVFVALQSVLQSADVDADSSMALAHVDAELTRRGWMEGLGQSLREGRERLRTLYDKPVSPESSFGIQAARLRDLYIRRSLLRRVAEWAQGAHTREEAIGLVEDVLEWASRAATTSRIVDDESFRPITQELLDEIETRQAGSTPTFQLASGQLVIDEILDGGVTLGHYTIIAAKRKMGKSRLAVAIMNSLLTQPDADWAVDLYSGEMTRRDLAKLFFAAHTGEPFDSVADPQIRVRGDWASLAVDGMAHLNDLDIRICVSKTTTEREITHRTKARRARLGDRPLCVVVDYLQDMGARGVPEYERVTQMTQSLAGLSKTVPNVWVLALAQFNRSAGADLPKPHQLRSSGQIEQDVDELLILHRPAMEREHSSAEDRRFGILWKALDRHGPPKKLNITADLARLRFE